MWARWALVIVLGVAGLVLAVCIPIIGGSWFADGVQRMGDASALADRGRRTVGIVQDKRAESGGPGMGVEKYVLVRFTTADGSAHKFWGDGDTDVGGAVRVLYDPRAPENAITDSVTEERVEAVTRIVGGALLFLVPIIGYVGFAWTRLRDLRRAVRDRRAA